MTKTPHALQRGNRLVPGRLCQQLPISGGASPERMAWRNASAVLRLWLPSKLDGRRRAPMKRSRSSSGRTTRHIIVDVGLQLRRLQWRRVGAWASRRCSFPTDSGTSMLTVVAFPRVHSCAGQMQLLSVSVQRGNADSPRRFTPGLLNPHVSRACAGMPILQFWCGYCDVAWIVYMDTGHGCMQCMERGHMRGCIRRLSYRYQWRSGCGVCLGDGWPVAWAFREHVFVRLCTLCMVWFCSFSVAPIAAASYDHAHRALRQRSKAHLRLRPSSTSLSTGRLTTGIESNLR